MTQQDTANVITFIMALLLAAVAFGAGWLWGYDTAMRHYTKKDQDEPTN
jgi:hypothetical protein